jgi:hypothetical protein
VVAQKLILMLDHMGREQSKEKTIELAVMDEGEIEK